MEPLPPDVADRVIRDCENIARALDLTRGECTLEVIYTNGHYRHHRRHEKITLHRLEDAEPSRS